jgi:tetratricopeptide (TPR) repeat protein
VSLALQEGFGLFQQGRFAEALTALRRAVAAEPNNPGAHHFLGLAAFQTGDIEGGVASIRQALALNPRDAAAHSNLASAFNHMGRQGEALTHFNSALAIDPGFLDALINRAGLLAALGRRDEAMADYGAALARAPGHPAILTNRANLLLDLGRAEEALLDYAAVLESMPDLAEAWANHANALVELGRAPEALVSGDRAVALNPASAHAQVNRGNALLALNRPAEALACYDQAVAAEPAMAQAWSNAGNALRLLGRHAEAIERCDKAIAIDPMFIGPLLNRATALGELLRYREALDDYAAGLRLQPGKAEAELSAGCAHLALGDFETGWRLYEARWRIRDFRLYGAKVDYSQPLWLGETPIAGKTILLRSEQGLGDILQFCRYADLLKDAGARVVLEAEAPLHRVLQTLRGADQLVRNGDPLPDFDVHAPLMSLPLALGTTIDTIPAQIPYLHADPALVAQWVERLGPRTLPRVGLVWSGAFRKDQPDSWVLNERRNIGLEALAPLKDLPLEFVSLQKGEPAESDPQRLKAQGWDGPDIRDFSAQIADFADTAALIETLDLVVAVDTSTAHMAGALGEPVWVLGRYDACWRWMGHREDSPWYPSMRLFHQSRFGDWDEVIVRLRAALKDFAA